jgi:DNA (cytosine-5)-methyltransferase 1
LREYCEQKKPRLFVFENVKGLLSHDKGNTFKTIISTLDELGYDTQWQVLNSKNFGVPQNRERVFIVGHLRGTSRPEVFPIRKDDQEDIESRQVCTAATVSTRTGSTAGGQQFIANTLDANYHKGNSATKERHTPRTEVMQDMKIRRLTPPECERLQGFPDNWTEGVSDTQRYKTLGNAVTVNVVEEIIKRLM